ncbi:MAG: YMGG-like glycine zipper-containing protein [Planctomycetota bacterium]
MRTLSAVFALTLFVVPAAAQEPVRKGRSYKKSVMIDPDYKPSISKAEVDRTIRKHDWKARRAARRLEHARARQQAARARVAAANEARARRAQVKREHRRARRASFPWATAIGAATGAVIGHQRGRGWEGAAVGAGFGLLVDAARSSRTHVRYSYGYRSPYRYSYGYTGCW